MVRPYADADSDALWALKRDFETGLGEGTGGEQKQAAYEAKLDADYRREWHNWVDRCVEANERCVQVAPASSEVEATLTGYVFVLPESLSFVWDAAVLNELYVRPDARGTGVADDLLEAAFATARDQDLPLDRLVLDVDGKNERAQAFYDRHGFEHWGEMVARDL